VKGENVMDAKQVGERIKSLRQERKMSQQEFADAIDVASSTVSMYENGERIPRDQIKLAIANLFGVTVDYLFFGNGTHEK
jgi:transcriptional regulator with XRE-family HTH domain